MPSKKACMKIKDPAARQRCLNYQGEFAASEDEKVKATSANWEYIVIGIFAIDKAIALSPSKWDDLIWTALKKAIYKAMGK